MIIIYESKTGFTKKYAEMLADKTKLKLYHIKDISKISAEEEVVFLGWIKVGKIQGLNKLHKYNLKAVCGSGTAPCSKDNREAVIKRNNIKDIPFFYLRGGCLPVKDLKGIDKILMVIFLKILKSRKEKDEETEEVIAGLENGFNGVEEKNLEPILKWLNI